MGFTLDWIQILRRHCFRQPDTVFGQIKLIAVMCHSGAVDFIDHGFSMPASHCFCGLPIGRHVHIQSAFGD